MVAIFAIGFEFKVSLCLIVISICLNVFIAEYLYGGSTRQLYQERNELLHDLAVVKQIGALLGTLKVSQKIYMTKISCLGS